MSTKPRWNTITISLPEDFFHITKTGKVKIMEPLTSKGNVKTIDKKKSVILKTDANIDKPTISAGEYQTQDGINKSGSELKNSRKTLGTAKKEATERRLKKDHGTVKRSIDTFIRQGTENEKNGEASRYYDKAVVVSNLKQFHENKKNAKESMNEKMARLRSLRGKGKPKN